MGDIEPGLQPKLLRFLDSGELYRVGDNVARRIDALLVSATNRLLERDVEAGRFRDDLLARLGQVVTIPPLRERVEDIPLLVEHFVGVYDRRPTPKVFAQATLDVLQRHRWPFNVRELQQVVERAVCLVDREVILPEDLPDYVTPEAALADSVVPPASAGSGAGPIEPLRVIVERAEKQHILQALEATKGNKRKAIELLQVAPETFYRRLQEFGLRKTGE